MHACRFQRAKPWCYRRGLLNRNFGARVSDSIKTDIRRELGLADESIIVLGCGAISIRKGVDIFIFVAQKSFGISDADIHFVWLGSLAVETDLYYRVVRDIEAGWSDLFIWSGERSDPAPYFRAADMFAMTSREDPFPCVVHEAMACELPVIAFEDAGGAPEAFDVDCGVTVPYRDVDAMAGADQLVGAGPRSAARDGRGGQGAHRRALRFP